MKLLVIALLIYNTIILELNYFVIFFGSRFVDIISLRFANNTTQLGPPLGSGLVWWW